MTALHRACVDESYSHIASDSAHTTQYSCKYCKCKLCKLLSQDMKYQVSIVPCCPQCEYELMQKPHIFLSYK